MNTTERKEKVDRKGTLHYVVLKIIPREEDIRSGTITKIYTGQYFPQTPEAEITGALLKLLKLTVQLQYFFEILHSQYWRAVRGLAVFYEVNIVKVKHYCGCQH